MKDKIYSHDDMLSLLAYIYNSDGLSDVHEQLIECWLNKNKSIKEHT
jgi:hypothetical protein